MRYLFSVPLLYDCQISHNGKALQASPYNKCTNGGKFYEEKDVQTDVDNLCIAINARKYRITNKGGSIGVQIKQCAEYAKRELSLDEKYNFLSYEDKGLSGYYSDRPNFQRMLHDIEMGKIRSVVC